MSFFSLSFSVVAQQPISGTVINSTNNLPVPAASVQVKGTNRIVQTAVDGKFSINASVGETLVITSIGFENYEVKIFTVNSQINVEMVTAASILSDVVVVGYGTEKK